MVLPGRISAVGLAMGACLEEGSSVGYIVHLCHWNPQQLCGISTGNSSNPLPPLPAVLNPCYSNSRKGPLELRACDGSIIWAKCGRPGLPLQSHLRLRWEFYLHSVSFQPTCGCVSSVEAEEVPLWAPAQSCLGSRPCWVYWSCVAGPCSFDVSFMRTQSK